MSDDARNYINGNDGDQPQWTDEQLQGLTATERKEIEMQVNKAKQMMSDAMNKQTLHQAETKLDGMVEKFRQTNGHQPSPWHIENMKRELRAQGIEIW